jgi:hypothetical protein
MSCAPSFQLNNNYYVYYSERKKNLRKRYSVSLIKSKYVYIDWQIYKSIDETEFIETFLTKNTIKQCG